jgi:hypothetical protein
VADRVKISNNPKGHQNGRNKDTILAAHLHTYKIQDDSSTNRKRPGDNGTIIDSKEPKKAKPNTLPKLPDRSENIGIKESRID